MEVVSLATDKELKQLPARTMAMSNTEKNKDEYIHYHKDGSIWAKGRKVGETPDGYWEWFRKDGTKLRSGCFKNGVQVGEWTTYDTKGDVYKVTVMKQKAAKHA